MKTRTTWAGITRTPRTPSPWGHGAARAAESSWLGRETLSSWDWDVTTNLLGMSLCRGWR